MMGGGAFILLKAGRNWPESAKQAKIRLAILLKILYTSRSGGEFPSPWTEAHARVVSAGVSVRYG
jgi:hypothetical protein